MLGYALSVFCALSNPYQPRLRLRGPRGDPEAEAPEQEPLLRLGPRRELELLVELLGHGDVQDARAIPRRSES